MLKSMVKTLSEAGLFVSSVNPHVIKDLGYNSQRKVKFNPADACKIARYTLDNWTELHQYSGKDNTYPGVNRFFDSLTHEYGSEKWVDYTYSFWHVDCVRTIGLKTFTERYKDFCKKHHYIFQQGKTEKRFNVSTELADTLPEYSILIGIYGVGKTYGPKFIAEIGNVSRFTNGEALTALAGINLGVDESG